MKTIRGSMSDNVFVQLYLLHESLFLRVYQGQYGHRGEGSLRVAINYLTNEIIITSQSNKPVRTDIFEYNEYEGNLARFVAHKLENHD